MSSKVAARYADGLLQYSQEIQQTDALADEMRTIIQTVKNSRDLQLMLASPFLESKKKISVTNEVFRTLSETSRNFISLIIRHGRESHVSQIAQKYIDRVEDLRGIQRVTLVSAAPLTEDNIRKILTDSGMIKDFGKFDLRTTVDPSLIGGYILRVGDQQIDASVKAKLTQLKKNFQLN